MSVGIPIDDGQEIPAAGAKASAGTASIPPGSPAVVGETAMASDNGDLPITLSFDDLLPDPNGEIVVMGMGGGAQLSILTDQKICAEGIAESHVTAAGVDVGGLSFFAFEGGTKLYYSPEIEIIITPPNS